MKKTTWVLLLGIFILGYFLRIMYLPQNALTFGYDQARDATIALQITQGDLKTLGPPASTPGLYHGVFYYYLLAPAYLAGSGSPVVAALWIAFLNALVVFLIFALAYQMTKSTKAAFIASFLFAISFESTQYAVWLSNPTIGIWTVPLIYFGLWNWLSAKKRWGIIVAALGLGLSVQAEIFLLYHAVPVALWVYMKRKEVKFRDLGVFGMIFVLAISTMLFAEIKFGFKSLEGFTSLLHTGDQVGFSKSFGDYLTLYLNQLGRVMAYNTYPGNIWIGASIVFGALIYALRERKFANKNVLGWGSFLASWIFSHASVVSVGGTSTPFLLVGIGPAVSILMGIVVWKTIKAGNKMFAVLLLILFIFGNLSMIIKENPKGQTIFAIQKDMLLSKQLKAIDYTYTKSQGEAFSINTLTSPLWINIVWTYLYKWHGGKTYGYTPLWAGRDQVGIVDSLTPLGKKSDVKNHFLIIEPMAGIPPQYLPLTIGEEDARSNLLEEKSFGEVVVQSRSFN